MSTSPVQTTARVEKKSSTASLRYHDPEKVEGSTTATDEDVNASPDETKQRWNESPTNIFRFLSTVYSFVLLGMTDAVLGALLPYVSGIVLRNNYEGGRLTPYRSRHITISPILLCLFFFSRRLLAISLQPYSIIVSPRRTESRGVVALTSNGHPPHIRPTWCRSSRSFLPSCRFYSSGLPSSLSGPARSHAPHRLWQRH